MFQLRCFGFLAFSFLALPDIDDAFGMFDNKATVFKFYVLKTGLDAQRGFDKQKGKQDKKGYPFHRLHFQLLLPQFASVSYCVK